MNKTKTGKQPSKAGPRKWTEAILKKRKEAGLGRGHGADYMPAIRVQDFSSRGVQSRIPSEKLKRTVHLHSTIERAFFITAEQDPTVEELEEQRPMDRSVTLGAAALLGIRHPTYPGGRVPVEMTLDALVTRRVDGKKTRIAYDIKEERALSDPRVIEKLSLHKAYCAHVGLAHRIFTEKSIDPRVIRNIDWMRGASPAPGEVLPVVDLFDRYSPRMEAEVNSANFEGMTVRAYCADFDCRQGLPKGCGLRLFRSLAWERRVPIDLTFSPVELQLLGKANGPRSSEGPAK